MLCLAGRNVLPVCLVTLFVFVGLAQAPVGSLTGSVRDLSGGLMQGVAITVTNQDNGLERQLVSSADGTFAAADLPPGNYAIKATASHFRTVIQTATVQVGQVATLDIMMEVGEAAEAVNIQSETPVLDYDTHTLSGVITRQHIENLPLNGRGFLQLSMLEPGVTVAALNLGQGNRQYNVNILGAQSNRGSIRITVDGANIADTVTGGTQQNFSQEVVQEFQLSSTNFDLSTGIGAGGAVNIVTRSGGNTFHGGAFFFFRDHNLAAYPYLQRDPHEPTSPFFARRQSGYQLGGPVKKDRLFFFSSLEHINQMGLFSAVPTNPLFHSFAANTSSPFHEDELTERLDWRISTRHNAFLRYSHDGNHGSAPEAPGGLPSDWDVNRNFADSGVISMISVLGPHTANEARYSMTYWSNTNDPPDASECPSPCIGLGMPNIRIRGVANFVLGNPTNAPQNRVLRRHIVADNLSRQQGTHAMKFGGYWEHQHGNGTYAYASPAVAALFSPAEVKAFNSQVAKPYRIPIPASFETLDDILKLPVARFSMGVGDINQPPAWNRSRADHDDMFHVYWQDNWRIHPRFQIDWGVAWSYEGNALNHDLTKPAYLAPLFGADGLGPELHSPRNFTPAVGFAWTPTRDNRTVIRGGAGIYYDTINLEVRLIERAMLGPSGTGRTLLGDSVFFPQIALMYDFDSLPTGFGPTSLSSEPTRFTAAALIANLPDFYSSTLTRLGPPGNTDLAIRNINVFKTGTELLARNFRPPYSEHVSIGIQREVRRDLVISANFVMRQYLHQMIRDTDLNHYYSADGPVIPACHGNQANEPAAQCSTGVIQGIISGARSHYRGLLIKADKRFSHRTTGTLSYSYASQVGYNGLIDDTNWFASWGPQAGHQILTGSLLWELPRGFQVSGISSFASAQPFQPVIAGVDLNSNGAVAAGETPGVPLPGGGYNQFNMGKDRGDLIQLVNQFNQTYAGTSTSTGTIRAINLPASFSFPGSFDSQDLRVTKTFHPRAEWIKLSIFGECFNLFNFGNKAGYSSNLNQPGFGIPTQRTPNVFGSGGPRAFQLGARLSF